MTMTEQTAAFKAQATAAVSKEAPRPLRSIDDIIADLSKPIAERHLKTRKQGGKDITTWSGTQPSGISTTMRQAGASRSGM